METNPVQIDRISFVIPVYNEEKTIRPLFEKIVRVMLREEVESYEVIFIDDGSADLSWNQMEDLVDLYPDHTKALRFRRNFGKSAALNAGFQEANGDIVITMDADLQDDPEEIPRFCKMLHEGFDLVSGWKEKRHDPLSKTFPSKIFNKVTSMISGVRLNDFNCGFKAYRKEVLEHIDLYGELHRFIPVLVSGIGFKVGEISVKHHPRMHGVSKYGARRYVKGFLDLLTVLCITRYVQRPGHLFGTIGIVSGVFGILSIGYLVVLWCLGFRPIGNRPLLLFGILAVIFSVQVISFGLLAEITIRNVNPRKVDSLIKEVLCKRKK